MTTRLTLFLLTAAATAALVTGCGSDSDDGSATAGNGQSGGGSQAISTSELSKEQFIKQAAEGCQRTREKTLERVLAYLQGHEKKNQTRAEEAAVFADMTRAVVVPTVEREISAIRGLGAPAGDEEEVEAFLVAEEGELAELSKLDRIVSRFQMERYFAPSAKLATEYGLTECANGEA